MIHTSCHQTCFYLKIRNGSVSNAGTRTETRLRRVTEGLFPATGTRTSHNSVFGDKLALKELIPGRKRVYALCSKLTTHFLRVPSSPPPPPSKFQLTRTARLTPSPAAPRSRYIHFAGVHSTSQCQKQSSLT